MKRSMGKIAYLGVLVALAFVFGYIESLLPLIAGIPGIKPGFANITVTTALYLMGKREAFLLTIVRVLLAGFTYGNMFSLYYSLAGAVVSLLIMLVLKGTKRFSVTGVSIAGGAVHNLSQIAVAYFLMGRGILYYLPFLIITGAIAGFATGIISAFIIQRLSRILPSSHSRQ